MSIRAVIIDDERNVRELLRGMLDEDFINVIEVVGEADDVEPAVQLIQEQKPDVAFLDIKMKRGTGFDVVSRLGDQNIQIIFVTAYDQYALKAFKFSAFGYLLKPIKATDLKSEIDRLQAHLSHIQQGIEERVKVLIDSYGDQAGQIKSLVISNTEGFRVVNFDSIVWLEAASNYTHFILTDGKRITVSKTLGSYETLLEDHEFFRIHQSYIVNMRHVTQYLKRSGCVKMSDGAELDISRAKKPAFVKRFG